VPPSAEDLDELAAEGGDVVRPAAGDEQVVHDHLPVDAAGAGIAQVGGQRRPGRQGAAAGDAGLDQHPRRVADRPDRLALVEEVADETDGVGARPQRVRVGDAAGKDEGVVVSPADPGDQPVHPDRARLVVMAGHLDLTGLDRDELHVGARVAQRLPRTGQLGLLDHVGRQERDLHALQLLSHCVLPVVGCLPLANRAATPAGPG
jgi:hypothetical protein